MAERHREGQLRIRAQALRDFTRLWPLWTGDDQSFNELVAATLPLILAYHRLSSSLAVQYYEALRKAKRITGVPTPQVGVLDAKIVVAGLVVTGRIQTKKALASGQKPDQAMQTALVRMSGNVTRHVLQGGRDAVMLSSAGDKQARGWERITGANPCEFCASLAGKVRSEAGGFEAHDHCSCSAAPAF